MLTDLGRFAAVRIWPSRWLDAVTCKDERPRSVLNGPRNLAEVGVAGSNPDVRSIPRVLTCFFSRLPNLAVAILPMSCPWLAHDPGRMVTLRRAREALHGEEGGEGVRPDPEDYEPRPDDDQHVPAPPLDGWCARPDAIQRLLPSSDHEERGGEQEADQHDGRHREGEERGAEPPGGQTLPGQTGQDRSRSPEPGQQVPEPEKDHPGARVAAAEPRLCPDDRSGDPVAEAVEGEGENLGLDEPQEDEPRSDRDAEDAPGGAREGDRSREAPAPERDERSDSQDEDHGAERERGGHPDATHPRASRPRGLPGQKCDEQGERAGGEERRHARRGEQQVAAAPASIVTRSQQGELHAQERRGSSRLEGQPQVASEHANRRAR